MPAGKPQQRSHILNYHSTREAQENRINKFVHMNGNDNPADIMNKSRAPNTCFPLMKPLLFWCDMDFLKEKVVAKGRKNRPSAPPLSKYKVNPHQYCKLEIFHILCN